MLLSTHSVIFVRKRTSVICILLETPSDSRFEPCVSKKPRPPQTDLVVRGRASVTSENHQCHKPPSSCPISPSHSFHSPSIYVATTISHHLCDGVAHTRKPLRSRILKYSTDKQGGLPEAANIATVDKVHTTPPSHTPQLLNRHLRPCRGLNSSPPCRRP